MEMPGLHPDQHGACLIVMKGSGIELLFELDETVSPGTVLVSTPLSSLRPESRLNMLTSLLTENKQLGPTLSKQTEEDTLYLHQRIHPDIDLPSLTSLIENFLHVVEACQKKLAGVANDAS